MTKEGNLVRRLLVLSGLILTGMLAMASVAQAHDDAADCDGTASGLTIRGDLNVPSGGSCQLINSTVRGDVKVRGGGYFQASNTTIRGDVKAKRSQTVFVEGGSTVKGNVVADRTSQVFLFASAIGGNIDVSRADDKVNVCGITVQGGIEVEKSGRDILVGDPLTTDCPGNVVKRGDIEILDNDTDVELHRPRQHDQEGRPRGQAEHGVLGQVRRGQHRRRRPGLQGQRRAVHGIGQHRLGPQARPVRRLTAGTSA